MRMILPFALGIAVMAFVYSPCIQAEHNSAVVSTEQKVQNHIAGILETFEDGLRTNEFDEEKFRLGFADILRDIRMQIKEDATRDTTE
jgi:hypothetical protein